MNILHILKNSLPYISGSTIRSKNILENQKKFANVYAYTGYNFKSDKKYERIDGIEYFRANPKLSIFLRTYNLFIQKIRKILYKFLYININSILSFLEIPISIITRKEIKKLVKGLNIDVIHQHSECQIGSISLRVARKLSIPYIYEVRAFLEDGIIVGSGKWRLGGKRLIRYVYNNIRIPETKILEKADVITTLCGPMKGEIVSRGISKDKIYIVPNGVDIVNINEKVPFNPVLPIIGYIGTIEKHEGISILIKVISLLTFAIPKIKLYLIGNAEDSYLRELKSLTKKLKCEENIVFVGRISYDKVKEYYRFIDIVVIPRLNRRVCRLVTPIKPLEAMAYKTLVIASDLPALRYVIDPYVTGVLFHPEFVTELMNKLTYYINHPIEKLAIECRARRYVEENFSWDKNIFKYKEIYEKLIYSK
ncbi:hypothetical protein LCGC14_0546460 [marine sediment metagenome]|uniref:Glycosyltransferase subfamily 4-like N-terminal domain-containing protein n=1 Tax=marine sediment metagenome TaxID=412755 RepID=A0A0F9UCI9_9ZZZZ